MTLYTPLSFSGNKPGVCCREAGENQKDNRLQASEKEWLNWEAKLNSRESVCIVIGSAGTVADGECIRLQRQRPTGKASIAVLAFVEPSESTMVGLNDELATKKIDSKGFKGELDGETFFLDSGVATLTR